MANEVRQEDYEWGIDPESGMRVPLYNPLTGYGRPYDPETKIPMGASQFFKAMSVAMREKEAPDPWAPETVPEFIRHHAVTIPHEGLMRAAGYPDPLSPEGKERARIQAERRRQWLSQ